MSKNIQKEGQDESTKRGKNFTLYEKNLLMDLVGQKKMILENKLTDATTNDEKTKAWEVIKTTYNSSNQSGIRTSKQLRELYKVLKKSARSNRNEDKVELVETGGGTFTPKSSDVDLKVQELCKNQFDPDQNPYDDSAIIFDDIIHNDLGELRRPHDLPIDEYYLPIVVKVSAADATKDPAIPEPSVQVLTALPPEAAGLTNSESHAVNRMTANLNHVTSTSTSSLTTSCRPAVRPSASWPKKSSSAATQKRQQVLSAADSIIQRKKIKNTYDEAAHNEKLKISEEKAVLLDTGKEIKKKDLQMKHQEKDHQDILFTQKLEILRIEAEIRSVELQTKKFERDIKEMKLKIKLDEYQKFIDK